MTHVLEPVNPEGPSEIWSPVEGVHTTEFLKLKTTGDEATMDAEGMERVSSEARDILGHCRNPASGQGNAAVLVVGYVQSGKTLSFTTVAALARDNGFGIVIVLAGTTKNLKSQSETRLETDLGLAQLKSAWTLESDPSTDDESNLKRIVDNWRRFRDGFSHREKPALLLTILKHSTRIRNAADVLRLLNLADVPALIIDDESDQASLNTKARRNLMTGADDSSTTYDSIVALRESLPTHSYLQYTATPQANLLLAISDALNPSYAKVIESGDSYTGGKYFFQQHPKDVIVKIPAKDVYDPKAPPADIPESLQDALRIYLLGAAAAAENDSAQTRSMMVQPSQNTQPHDDYAKWIEGLLGSWSGILRSEAVDAKALIISDFRDQYAVLQRTVSDLPDFSALVDLLPEICEEVRVVQVNSVGQERKIRWNSDQFWILVGGQKLDRGFTVEGLTVTYMPRNVSENADVLQQRGRFFGYRLGYIGYCRVYMPALSIDAFSGYVRDEEYLRQSLIKQAGLPLKEWRRQFLLHGSIGRLTRSNATGRKLRRLKVDRGWVFPKNMQSEPADVLANRTLLKTFSEQLESQGTGRDMASVVTDLRKDTDANLLYSQVPVKDIVEFLVALRISDGADATLVTALVMGLRQLSDEHLDIDVILLSRLSTRGQNGRTLTSLQTNLFVGRNPDKTTDASQLRYVGDRDLRDGDRPTLHLRSIKLNQSPGVSDEIRDEVPWFALYLPTKVANDLLIEEF